MSAQPQAHSGLWRPPQYQQPQLYSVTVTLPSQNQGAVPANASGGAGAPTTFYFDGVLLADINEEVYLTKHPAQNGASITDHAYALPVIVTLGVFFSDAMDSVTPNQYTGSPSKSVAAYQQFQTIKNLRLPCTLATRLSQYANMVITQLRPTDSRLTRFSLRMMVRFEQIIVGQVVQQQASARQQQTNSTDDGTVAGDPVPQSAMGLADPSAADQPQWNSSYKSIF